MAPPRMKQVHPGERYGRGVVIAEITLTRRSRPWRGALLSCDCGTLYETAIYDLLRDRYPTRSCGCLYQDRGRSRGLSRTHYLYGTWANMMTRCYNPNWPQYKDWGGRGITVCDRWHDAKLFIEDIEHLLGPRPDGMTLDRADNDGNYEPGNVRWATRVQQARNTRRYKGGVPSEKIRSSRRYKDGTRKGTLYASWWRIMRRCPDEMCPRWHDWLSFREDIEQQLGTRPPGLRLDRIDDSCPYEPGNMAWITGAEQVRRAQQYRWPR